MKQKFFKPQIPAPKPPVFFLLVLVLVLIALFSREKPYRPSPQHTYHVIHEHLNYPNATETCKKWNPQSEIFKIEDSSEILDLQRQLFDNTTETLFNFWTQASFSPIEKAYTWPNGQVLNPDFWKHPPFKNLGCGGISLTENYLHYWALDCSHDDAVETFRVLTVCELRE